jgi:hypothetical protein
MSRHVHKLPEHRRSISSQRPREVALASEKSLQPLAPSAILQRAALAPESLRPAEVVRMQQTLGNRAVEELLSRSSSPRPLIQAKLAVNAPGDEYEQEADRVAGEVMRMPAVQRAELEDEDEEPDFMTKREWARAAGGAFEAGEDFEQPLRASRGQGQPLPPSLREEFETKFGADFSGVRVHADAQSDALNRSIQAKAFTTGQDVFFRQGTYEPWSRAGQELIAHELTHVVQQRSGEVHDSLVPPDIVQLQRTIGSQAVSRLLRGRIQRQAANFRPDTRSDWLDRAVVVQQRGKPNSRGEVVQRKLTLGSEPITQEALIAKVKDHYGWKIKVRQLSDHGSLEQIEQALAIVVKKWDGKNRSFEDIDSVLRQITALVMIPELDEIKKAAPEAPKPAEWGGEDEANWAKRTVVKPEQERTLRLIKKWAASEKEQKESATEIAGNLVARLGYKESQVMFIWDSLPDEFRMPVIQQVVGSIFAKFEHGEVPLMRELQQVSMISKQFLYEAATQVMARCMMEIPGFIWSGPELDSQYEKVEEGRREMSGQGTPPLSGIDTYGIQDFLMDIGKTYKKDKYWCIGLGACAEPMAVGLKMMGYTVKMITISGIPQKPSDEEIFNGLKLLQAGMNGEWPPLEQAFLVIDSVSSGAALPQSRELIERQDKKKYGESHKRDIVLLSLNNPNRPVPRKMVVEGAVHLLQGGPAMEFVKERFHHQIYKEHGPHYMPESGNIPKRQLIGRMYPKSYMDRSRQSPGQQQFDKDALRRMVYMIMQYWHLQAEKVSTRSGKLTS